MQLCSSEAGREKKKEIKKIILKKYLHSKVGVNHKAHKNKYEQIISANYFENMKLWFIVDFMFY